MQFNHLFLFNPKYCIWTITIEGRTSLTSFFLVYWHSLAQVVTFTQYSLISQTFHISLYSIVLCWNKRLLWPYIALKVLCKSQHTFPRKRQFSIYDNIAPPHVFCCSFDHFNWFLHFLTSITTNLWPETFGPGSVFLSILLIPSYHHHHHPGWQAVREEHLSVGICQSTL